MIRIFLVEDSPTALTILSHGLEVEGDIEVVGAALRAEDAFQSLPGLRPDLLITDFMLPGLDGLGLIQWVMAHCPLPILVMSDLVAPGSARAVACLEAGAVDLAAKPASHDPKGESWARFRAKVRLLAALQTRRPPSPSEPLLAEGPPVQRKALSYLALGASTGGPEALRVLLGDLKPDLRIPVLVVQHMSEEFLGGFSDWLMGAVGMAVRLATEGMHPAPGTIHLAPAGVHLELDPDGALRLHPPGQGGVHVPSIDRLFQSLADHHAPRTGAILLTGMGRDGAAGLLALRTQGARTAVQDEGSSVVFGMPKAAADLGAAEAVLPLRDLPGQVRRWLA